MTLYKIPRSKRLIGATMTEGRTPEKARVLKHLGGNSTATRCRLLEPSRLVSGVTLVILISYPVTRLERCGDQTQERNSWYTE
jgi:hypothetical protein